MLVRFTKSNDLKQILARSGARVEPEPARFQVKWAGVGAIKGKWPAPEPESELKCFESFAPEQRQEPFKFSRLHQLWRDSLCYLVPRLHLLVFAMRNEICPKCKRFFALSKPDLVTCYAIAVFSTRFRD